MAEIVVQKKKPVWGFVALLLLGFVLIGTALYLRGTRADVQERGRAADTGAITSLTQLHNQDVGSVVGRTVDLDGARVLSVTGDRVFWVDGSTTGQVLVVLDEQRTPGMPGVEGRYDVNPGQTLNITGTVQRFPGWDEARTRWKADPAYQKEFESQQVYIHADKLEITNRP